MLGNLGLSQGIVLASRPYTLYVYVTGANLTDIRTIKNIVDKPLSGANLNATTTTPSGGSNDVTVPATTAPQQTQPATTTQGGTSSGGTTSS